MSYDRQLNQVCTHEVIEEALFLSSDRVTVRPLRPIAASASVKVRFNGTQDVPITGLLTPAQALGSKPGPFTIQGGVNDRLVFQVDGGPAQTVTIPSGNQISASRIAEALAVAISNAIVDTTSKRQLRVKTSRQGSRATLQILSTGTTAATLLGLPTDRMWRGSTVTPAWSIVNDPNTLADRPTRLILFDAPLKGYQDFVELNYSTLRQECRRCGGLGVENDWRYDRRGNVVTVTNENLLEQEMLKAIYTTKGSNPFHPWYGTHVVDSIGSKLSSNGLFQNMVVSEIYEAFRRWQSIKKQQEETVGQEVSDEEYPFRILSVKLSQSDVDPTILFVAATIQNRSTKPITIERGIRTPLPYDILGSTQQETFFNGTFPDYSKVKG